MIRDKKILIERIKPRNKIDISQDKALETLFEDVLTQVDNLSDLKKLTQVFL